MDDYIYEESADEYSGKAFSYFVAALMCVACFMLGLSIGCHFGESTGRDEIWKQAVDKDKAEVLETSGGTFYKWKS